MTQYRIPLTKPYIGEDENKAITSVLSTGQLTNGEQCRFFEEELAKYIGCEYVIVCSSGTAALHLILLAHKIFDKIIMMPDFTYPSVANIIELTGNIPLFTDVNIDSYNMDCNAIFNRIDWIIKRDISYARQYNYNDLYCKLKMIIFTHQFGRSSDVFNLENKIIIEDAACAIGSHYSTDEKVGSKNTSFFSFHPRKLLTTGEGGCITTNNYEIAKDIKHLANHGLDEFYGNFVMSGLNYKMTEMQAAIGRIQLKKLDEHISLRQNAVKIYINYLAEINNKIERKVGKKFKIKFPNYNSQCNYQNLMILLPSIRTFPVIQKMKNIGIQTQFGSYVIHELLDYKERYDKYKYYDNNSSYLARYGLSLPLYYDITEEEIKEVTNELYNMIIETSLPY